MLSFCNQALASYVVTQSICFIVRVWGVGGGRWGKRAVNASKRQTLPPTPSSSTSAVLPSSDLLPADRAIPGLDTECLTVVVNVLGGQLKRILSGGVRGNDLRCCCGAAPMGPGRIWGPVGRDSSPGYSWLNGRQTAGREED